MVFLSRRRNDSCSFEHQVHTHGPEQERSAQAVSSLASLAITESHTVTEEAGEENSVVEPQ